MAEIEMDPSEAVAKHGLKAIAGNHLLLGVISSSDLSADDFSSLHAMVSSDLMKLIKKMKTQGVKICAVLDFDGNPVTSMVGTILKQNRVPAMFLTSVAPNLANNTDIWYTDNLKKTFLESCTLVLNYQNQELSDYLAENEIENVDMIERKLRPREIDEARVIVDENPYASFEAQVKNKLHIQRMPFQGIRLNQIIDLRPPRYP